MDLNETRQVKGVIIEPEDADVFAMHLPDDTYVVVFPIPMCGDKHPTPEEAFRCSRVKEEFTARARNSRVGQREPGGYL